MRAAGGATVIQSSIRSGGKMAPASQADSGQ